MIFEEKRGDLFSIDSNKYVYAHCISADCKMGAGIAVPIREKFGLGDMRDVLIDKYDATLFDVGKSVYYNGVYNLITKERYFHKPTYESITQTIVNMYHHAEQYRIEHIAMPRIGTGLDKLEWNQVRTILLDVFLDSHISILVCYL